MTEIFSNVTTLVTGGLKIDMMTVITALLFISVVLMGLAWVQSLFDEQLFAWKDAQAEKRMEGMGALNGLRRKAHKYKGTAEGDVYSYNYKKAIREYDYNDNEPVDIEPSEIVDIGGFDDDQDETYF